MPHLSPMEWIYMLMSSWLMLTLISINLFFMNNKSLQTTKCLMTHMTLKWKWCQGKKMNCKFMNDTKMSPDTTQIYYTPNKMIKLQTNMPTVSSMYIYFPNKKI